MKSEAVKNEVAESAYLEGLVVGSLLHLWLTGPDFYRWPPAAGRREHVLAHVRLLTGAGTTLLWATNDSHQKFLTFCQELRAAAQLDLEPAAFRFKITKIAYEYIDHLQKVQEQCDAEARTD